MKLITKIGGSLLVALVSAPLALWAVPISGTVFDETDFPMPGVNVIVKGTTKGTVSDIDGKFIIDAEKGQTLLMTFIGYENYELMIGDKLSGLSAKLSASASVLDEIVVVGYGQVSKKDLSGSVTSVSMNELEKTPVASLENALSGRMAGVQVTSSEGGPGASVDITIRGGNSLTGSNAPLWVIDGFPVDDPNSFSLDARDIAEMQVLKDASATAIYGARGANGVIIIQTKGGDEAGKVSVEYNGSVGASYLPKSRQIDMMSGTDFLLFSRANTMANSSNGSYSTIFDDRYLVNELYKRDYKGGPYTLDANGEKINLKYDNAADFEKLTIEDYKNQPSYNWQDEAFKTAITQSHRVALSGGNKQTRYNVSASMFDQNGTLIGTGLEKYNLRFSFDQKISKKISFNTVLAYNTTRRDGLQSSEGARNSVIRDILQYQPVNPIKYGELGVEGVPSDVDTDITNLTYHPIKNIKNAYREIYYDQFTANARIDYEIITGLKFMLRGGYTYYAVKNDTYNNAESRYGNPILSVDGINASIASTKRENWFNEYTLAYNKKWGKSRFDILGGYTMEGLKEFYIMNRYIGFPFDNMGMNDMSLGKPTPAQNSTEEYFSMSFLGRVNYVWNDRYIFTASFRADGSSKFLEGNHFGYFPSGAVAWRVSEENWLKSVEWISNLKLRASWGMTGNNKIAARSAHEALANNNSTGYFFDNQYIFGYLPIRIRNASLKWETTRQTDIGVDLSVLRNRINLTVDWYDKQTDDLLLNADLPNSSGYSKAQKNVGSIRNRGWEISLNTVNINNRKFRWTSDFNISFNKNEVTELNSGQTYMLTNPNWYFRYNQNQYIAEIGQPASMFYGYVFDGIYQVDDFYYSAGKYIAKENVPNKVGNSNPVPGSIKYKDLDGNGTIDANDMKVIGDPNPVHYGGFNNTFTFGNFDASIFLTWSYGNEILNANREYFMNFDNSRNNYLAESIDYWSMTNPSNEVYLPKTKDYWVSSRSVEDGSYLRISNVTIGYNLNASNVSFLKKIGLTKIRFYVTGDNLYVFTKYSGYDPEVTTSNSALTRGLDYSSYPRSRTFTFGLDLKF